ncbi:hypothetical protein TNCV_3350831 [Trichonephila clavipes]|nr:hypothetical protein TNCV_3350831 [Trichonephila clavipes]
MIWPMEAAIKILHMVAALPFQKLLLESNKISVPLGGRPPYKKWYEGNHPGAALLGTGSGRDETTLVRGFAVNILELNGMRRVLKFTLLVFPKSLLSTSWLVLVAIGASCSQFLAQFFNV